MGEEGKVIHQVQDGPYQDHPAQNCLAWGHLAQVDPAQGCLARGHPAWSSLAQDH